MTDETFRSSPPQLILVSGEDPSDFLAAREKLFAGGRIATSASLASGRPKFRLRTQAVLLDNEAGRNAKINITLSMKLRGASPLLAKLGDVAAGHYSTWDIYKSDYQVNSFEFIWEEADELRKSGWHYAHLENVFSYFLIRWEKSGTVHPRDPGLFLDVSSIIHNELSFSP